MVMPSMADCYYSAVDRWRSTGEMSVFFRIPGGDSLVRSEPQRKHRHRNTANTRIPQTSPNSVQSTFCDLTEVFAFWTARTVPRGKINHNPVGYYMITLRNSFANCDNFSRSSIQILNSSLPHLLDDSLLTSRASLIPIENIGR